MLCVYVYTSSYIHCGLSMIMGSEWRCNGDMIWDTIGYSDKNYLSVEKLEMNAPSGFEDCAVSKKCMSN